MQEKMVDVNIKTESGDDLFIKVIAISQTVKH